MLNSRLTSSAQHREKQVFLGNFELISFLVNGVNALCFLLSVFKVGLGNAKKFVLQIFGAPKSFAFLVL